MRSIDKKLIKKILVISLSNIGDVILTLPVIDKLIEDFSEAKISVVIGPKAKTLLSENKIFDQVYVFDKHQPLIQTIKWVLSLRKERFDLVVDLRHTAIPVFINAKNSNSLLSKKEELHKKNQHLKCLKSIYDFQGYAQKRSSLYVSSEDKKYIEGTLSVNQIMDKKYLIISAGAASEDKRWTEEGFAQLADYFIDNYGLKIIFVGDENDRKITQNIFKVMHNEALNLCGRTTLVQLAEIIQRSFFVVANDSSVMHMASYLDVPTLAIFGPSNPKLYGPWGKQSAYVKNCDSCLKCKDKNTMSKHSCLLSLASEDVINRILISNDKVEFKG